MNILKIMMIMLFMLMSLNANNEILVFKADNSKGKITPKTIEKVMKKAGYKVDVNRNMNKPFEIQFKKTTFDTYNLLIAYYPAITKDLTIKYPDSGIFNPFSVGIYQKKGSKDIFVSVLSAKGMSKILGKGEEFFKKLEEVNKKTFLEALPNAKIVDLSYSSQATKEKLLTKFEIEVDPEEADDTIEEIEMVIENGLKPIGFIKANFNDYGIDLDDAGNEDYIFYHVYSLCKLKVIYNVAKTHPEAGSFAPCSMAIYQKEGSNKMVIVFPNVYNWISIMNLQDKELIGILLKAQSDIVKLISSATE